MIVKTGLDTFIKKIDSYKNRNAALIANQTSVAGDLRYSWDVLIENGIKLEKIFSPEHGIFSTEQDQVPVISEPEHKFKIVSLYGDSYESLLPEKEQLENIDLVIFDIQDVGSRYYTYLNTMILFMKEISNGDIKFVVLDRPNPLGGIEIEGPVLQQGYESFVGLIPVTIRHGLTAGEIALMAADYFSLTVDLEIINMDGWEREMLFQDTGLPWIPPSPNMPDVKTAYLYPGGCLFEGTNISEGRGTTIPFENIGSPFIDPYKLADHMNSLNLDGVYFRPVYFKTEFNKYAGDISCGLFIHITDERIFKSFLTGIAIIEFLSNEYKEFEFLEGVYEFNNDYPAFDLLTGSSNIREMIISGRKFNDISNFWIEDEMKFKKEKEKYHLY